MGLPSPYKLFLQWCEKNLQGDWAADSTRRNGTCIFGLLIADAADVETLHQRFGLKPDNATSKACAKSHILLYSDTDYVNLAKELGLKIG